MTVKIVGLTLSLVRIFFKHTLDGFEHDCNCNSRLLKGFVAHLFNIVSYRYFTSLISVPLLLHLYTVWDTALSQPVKWALGRALRHLIACTEILIQCAVQVCTLKKFPFSGLCIYVWLLLRSNIFSS
jgi:hypothetical protein